VPDDDKTHDNPAPEPEAEAPAEEAKADEKAEDKLRLDAIAARVEGIGQEDELDRIAREEERKLLERKKGSKKGKKGLEAAASRRLAKIGEVKVKRPSAVADAVSPDADPLLERAARLNKWIKDHRQTFGGIVAVAALAVAGGVGYVYWQDKRQADASVILAQAYAAEHGHVSDKEDDEEEDTSRQLYPTFKTVAARREAAIAKYHEVESKYAGTGAAILARLAEAGLLLDANDAGGARTAYQDVKASPLAQADAEVRGRACEGIGFANELLARSDEANKDKHLDDALASFKELEAVDMKGFKELGQYHEARVLQAKGDKAKAIELLKEVVKRATEPGAEAHAYAYLEYVAGDRLRELDPTALPPKPKAPKAGPGGPGGGVDTSDPEMNERIQELLRQMQEKGGGAPGSPPGAPPGAPQ
jgi:hypothetical protein